MIKAEISGDVGVLHGPFPFPFIKIVSTLSGRKKWENSREVKILATPGNLRILKECDHPIEWSDVTGALAEQAEMEALATQHSTIAPLSGDYRPKIKLYKHQNDSLSLGWERMNYAYLLEMGLGKTAIMIANAGMLHLTQRLTGVLIIAPKGVHSQWVDEEIPKHLDERIEWKGFVWRKKLPKCDELRDAPLIFLSMNIDALKTKSGGELAAKFLNDHRGKSMMILDESHLIKNGSADRTKFVLNFGQLATYRRIATGTPIAKNIMDAWSQFNFLDPRIIGHKYATAFRARYCVMGGWEGRQIVGQKNTEEFYGLIAPHCFRMTKGEALDLPPKLYIPKEYDMSDATRKHYDEIKATLMTEMEDGSFVDAQNPAVALLRLQQVICGHLPSESGMQQIGGERLMVMLDILDQVEGQVVIWSRFIEDSTQIQNRLFEHGETYAVYRGSDEEKKKAKDRFIGGEVRCFVGNPSSGGTGLDGLQHASQNVIYYSNSFNSLHRWQSEDRTHRIGTKGAVTYFDLVARRTIDRMILRNLKGKKSVSDLTFDQIRRAIADPESISVDAGAAEFEKEVAEATEFEREVFDFPSK